MIPKWIQNLDPFFLDPFGCSNSSLLKINTLIQFKMDFANKYLGGGVLNTGCVQEEIRFMICPELIVSTLITERLNDHECAQIKGCERFSNYKGYASSFKWSGNYADKTPRDNWQRMFTHLLVVDALYFGRRSHQFRAEQMRRELDKCFVGFCRKFNDEQANLPAIATGNWGCGAFNGDKQLKCELHFYLSHLEMC